MAECLPNAFGLCVEEVEAAHEEDELFTEDFDTAQTDSEPSNASEDEVY
jgi:hypothetical protein